MQRQLGEVAPLLVSAVTIVGALLGANNFIDNRIEASSREAAAANKELAMQIADLSKETAIGVVVSICVAVFALGVAVIIAQRQPQQIRPRRR